jgi:Na+-transporting methylmalonyl-CoA/oxaloacetate decarboxylase gamma subunit
VGRVLLAMGRVFFFVVLLVVVLSGYSACNKRRDVEIKRLK